MLLCIKKDKVCDKWRQELYYKFLGKVSDSDKQKIKELFAKSVYLKDQTVLPPEIAYNTFGRFFEVYNGNVCLTNEVFEKYFDVSNNRMKLTIDTAIKGVIDNYPYKNGILRDKDFGKELKNMTPAERLTKFKEMRPPTRLV